MNASLVSAGIARRWRQFAWLARTSGVKGIADQLRLRAGSALQPRLPHWPVFPADVLAADFARPYLPPVPPVRDGEPIRLNWVMTGPGLGSGGHTTIFRAIKHLEANGYRSRIYLYHPALTDPVHYAGIIGRHYGFDGPVERLEGRMADAHGVVATNWGSAYAVFNARCAGKRFYLVQDFEPDFHPVGVERVLAESTYSMGFHALTAGKWLAGKLSADYGMSASPFDFGCDTLSYANRGEPRTGIAFYARPSTPRRGFELGLLALQLFADRNPNIEIHLYGERVGATPFRCVDHGLATPAELNDLYNCCFAGLSLSLTNVSLVPLEMLAAGCIAVVNDAPHNRIVLDNPHVSYAAANPQALAAALEGIVRSPRFPALSAAASQSQQSVRWEDAGRAINTSIRAALGGPGPEHFQHGFAEQDNR